MDKYLAGDSVSMDQFVVSTPGQLQTGYRWEGDNNRFHGGTILNDAATDAIWVENQVFLGAGETIMAKTCFEEWLWHLACAEIKHIHSDNGVFYTDVFHANYVEKYQSQSFSGVGAHYQSAHAEHNQTIMYMARTFMLHVSLHWSEYGIDDLVLWPYAIKHAIWLCNWILSRTTILTPMELLTKTHTDHWDLLRTHVLGCFSSGP